MRKHIEIVDKGIEVGDKEIESYMDFDSLLERNKMHAIRNQIENKITRKLFWLVVVAVLIGSTSYFLLKEDNSESQIVKLNGSEESFLQPDDKVVEVAEVKTSSPDEIIVPNKDDIKELPKEAESIKSKFQNEKKKTIAKHPDLKQTNEVGDKESVATQTPIKESYVYLDAEPIDGIQELYKYFEENLKYPEEALADSVQGTVLVRFTILKDGKVDNLIIEKTLGPLFDLEAKRLISGMPLWKPATVNNTPVVSRMSIPLHFNIKK
jgi:TonB family protein